LTFIVLNIIPFMRYLSSLFLFFLLVSCKSLSPTTIASAASMASTTIHTRDTIFLRDSIFISERQRGDTVYLTRTEYRDRWRTHLVHDTVVKTDSIVQVIEHPPERYIPRFHKTCTTLFCLLFIGLIIYLFFKLRSC
jgi:hypothetical protein